MLDWQIYEGDELPDLVVPPDPPPPRSWAWLLLAGALLLGLGSAALYWQLRQREATRARDLHVFILAEERARQGGLVEHLETLVVPDAPAEWKRLYQETFEGSRAAHPVAVQVVTIEWQGEAALVQLRLGNESLWRYYRLVGREWRRAPLPAALGHLESDVSSPTVSRVERLVVPLSMTPPATPDYAKTPAAHGGSVSVTPIAPPTPNYAATLTAHQSSTPVAPPPPHPNVVTPVAPYLTPTPDYAATIIAAQTASPIVTPPPTRTPTPTLSPYIVKALVSLPPKAPIATPTRRPTATRSPTPRPTLTPTLTATLPPNSTPPPTPTPTPDYAGTVIGPATTTPVSGSLSVFAIRRGDCFNAPAAGEFVQVSLAPCRHLHDYEAYFLGDYAAAPEAAFPGETFEPVAQTLCLAVFESYVGRAYHESVLQVSYLRPTAASWVVGDREIVCLLYHPLGKLNKSMKNSRR